MNSTAQFLKDKISEYQNIIIAKHKMPDWDAVGSAEGLRKIILDNFDNKNVFVVGHEITNTKLIDDEKLNDEIISSAILITVDTANVERLDFERINDVKETFRIDHHINVSPYTENEFVFPEAIACTQVVTLWAHEMNLKISKEAGEYLYRGLLTDSNRFAYKNTSSGSFEAAKILVEVGVQVDKITREIYRRSFSQAKWCNEAFTRIKYDAETKFAYITGTEEDLEKFSITPDEFKSALSAMSGIDEIDVWALIYKIEENARVKISLRSKEIDINKLATAYGGGGHLLASGGYIDTWDQLDDFLIEAKKYLKGERKNG